MPTRRKSRLHHLFVANTAQPAPYTYPKPVRGPKANIPARERAEHAASLREQLESVRAEEDDLRALRSAAGISAEMGMYLSFESEPEFDLAFLSLDRARDGLELVAVQEQADRTFATVFVPDGKLGVLVHLVEQYANEDHPRYGRPKNRTLVESISHIRRAALDAFWTDDPDAFPPAGKSAWWEVWLRGGKNDDRVPEFKQLARSPTLSSPTRRAEVGSSGFATPLTGCGSHYGIRESRSMNSGPASARMRKTVRTRSRGSRSRDGCLVGDATADRSTQISGLGRRRTWRTVATWRSSRWEGGGRSGQTWSGGGCRYGTRLLCRS